MFCGKNEIMHITCYNKRDPITMCCAVSDALGSGYVLTPQHGELQLHNGIRCSSCNAERYKDLVELIQSDKKNQKEYALGL